MGRAEGAVQSFTTIDDAAVTTLAVLDAAQTTATLRGDITSNGGGTISASGFKYGTDATLATATDVASSAITGEYTEALTGLSQNTQYYFHAFATNEAGMVTGDTLSFSTVGPCGGDFSITYWDYDYSLVEIGDECWFSENLRTTKLRDGTLIASAHICAPDSSIIQMESSVYPLDCTNDEAYISSYGYLYSIIYMSNSAICPAGWEVPTEADWNALKAIAGNSASALMSADGWDGDPLNNLGFNALPGGAASGEGSLGGSCSCTFKSTRRYSMSYACIVHRV